MNKYADVAIRATRLVTSGTCCSPQEAWLVAARLVFPTSVSSQAKGCPKGAYLGLCEEGLVRGIPRGVYTRSHENKQYAVDAVRLLLQDSTLADSGMDDGGAANLWRRVMRGRDKHSNGQMEVVLGLWAHGLIVTAEARQRRYAPA
jgi:hypothetical protein